MKTSGYSGTPLAKKLGIKENFKIKLVNEPAHYFSLFEDFPKSVEQVADKKTKKNLIHYFTLRKTDFHKDLLQLKKEIEQDGMIWVSWPKKTSKVATDITEDVIRDFALNHGLVDVKVCAVDETWSGLKLVIPVTERKS